LQQKLATLQEQINSASHMQLADDTSHIIPVHSFDGLPSYYWNPSQQLTTLIRLNVPLRKSQSLQNKEFLMAHLSYEAPATIPMAEH
ncbi:hypothetical protein BD408DRAFT_328633, partial [Parasitella parasitica]